MDRIEDRTTAILRALLRDGGPERDAAVLDLSSRGLMASAKPPPRRGTFVELIVGRHSLVGQVKWSLGNRFGVRLRERIDVLAVIGNETGPVALKAAQRARAKPTAAARFAFSRQAGRVLTFALLIAAALGAAVIVAGMVSRSLSSFDVISSTLRPR